MKVMFRGTFLIQKTILLSILDNFHAFHGSGDKLLHNWRHTWLSRLVPDSLKACLQFCFSDRCERMD